MIPRSWKKREAYVTRICMQIFARPHKQKRSFGSMIQKPIIYRLDLYDTRPTIQLDFISPRNGIATIEHLT